MMLKTAACLLISGLICESAAGMNPMFRTYGNATILGKPYAHRVGAAGYVRGADFITVGKLDGSTVGPFAGMDEAEITKRWMLLRLRKPIPNYGSWTSWITWFDRWNHVYSVQQYESTMRAIIGDDQTPLYAKDVLKAQIAAETPLIEGMILERIAELEETAADKATFVPVLHFEVANEPNAFPAITPEMYSWYYLKWKVIVEGKLANVNRARTAAGKQNAVAKVMPAGLWSWEGLPGSIVNILDKGISATVAGITLDARIPTNTRQYYQDFLTALGKPQFCDQETSYHNSNTLTLVTLCSEYRYLGAIYISKWEYRDAQGRVRSCPPGMIAPTNSGFYYRYPVAWEPYPITNLIDMGNVHFYPYLGIHSSMDLNAQFASLKSTVDLMASNSKSGKVWMTEVGNMNPWSETKVVADMMTPTLTRLAKGEVPQVERLYWYQAHGNDHKFEMLDDLPSQWDIASYKILYSLWRPIVNLLPGMQLPDLPGSAEEAQIYQFLEALKNTNPPQGLFDDDGNLTLLGRNFHRLAGGSNIAPILGLLLE